MKNGLVKITGENNLYYDSTIKQYKFVMHCPLCGKYSGCWCFPDFESIPMWDEECPNTYCSDRCFVLDLKEDLEDIAAELKITIKPTIEEWTASKVVHAYLEEYLEDGDLYFDCSGKSCEV